MSVSTVSKIRRTEPERIEYFKNQPECGEIESHRALCTRCTKWVNLGKKQTYTVKPWEAHRTKCDRQILYVVIVFGYLCRVFNTGTATMSLQLILQSLILPQYLTVSLNDGRFWRWILARMSWSPTESFATSAAGGPRAPSSMICLAGDSISRIASALCMSSHVYQHNPCPHTSFSVQAAVLLPPNARFKSTMTRSPLRSVRKT